MTDEGLTRDAFLGGRLHIWQPREGYRAGMDPVLLAAACPARMGETVLELGCGVGVAALCLASRVPGLSITGVERNGAYAELAQRNAAENALPCDVVAADLTGLPKALREQSFDHVIANPPYFTSASGSRAEDYGRDASLREQTPLAEWINASRKRLKPKGHLTLINDCRRLPECLSALRDGFGAIAVLPIQSRPGAAADRVLIRARKGSATPFTLHPPFLIHQGARHNAAGPDFTPAIQAVLRQGRELPFA